MAEVDIEELLALTEALKPWKARASKLGYDLVLRDARPVSETLSVVPAASVGNGEAYPFKMPTDAVEWAIPRMEGQYTTRQLMKFVGKVDAAVVDTFDYSSFSKALSRRARNGGPLKATITNGKKYFERIASDGQDVPASRRLIRDRE